KSYVHRFPDRVKYIYQINKGPASARNLGIARADGEYVAFLDADDVWLETRLETALQFMERHPECALTHAKTIRIKENGERLPEVQRNKALLSGNIYEHILLRKENISCLTVMVRKSVLDKVGTFDESPLCVAVEDRDMWLRIAKQYQILFIDEVLGFYRMRDGSISRDDWKAIDRKLYVINKNCPKNSALKNLAISRVYKESADGMKYNGYAKEAKAYYKKALLHWPWNMYLWKNFIQCEWACVKS
ncbi:MAG: glycosyltransferase family 2 protein, partial [Candidatus Omnitrophica bacterium]|nr:glycosyltransferase family 2 protein [Candidatus Omnitrophota bacterium]